MRMHLFSSPTKELTNIVLRFENIILELNLDDTVTEDSFELSTSSFDIKQKELSKTKIDLALILMSDKCNSELVKNIRAANSDCVIIGIFKSAKEFKIHALVDDYALIESINSDECYTKVRLWVELANLRTHNNVALIRGKNAFGITVWNRRTRFYIQDECSLGLIWEYFLNDKRFDKMHHANNWIQACYSVCAKLLSKKIKPVVVFEENDKLFFLTISSLDARDKGFYEELVEYAQLDKMHLVGHSYKKSKGVFTIHLAKDLANRLVLLKDDKTQKQTSAKSTYIPGKNLSLSVDTAKNYVKECGIEEDDLAELEMLEKEIKDDLLQVEEPSRQLQLYGNFFSHYAQAINQLLEFEELRVAVESIGEILNSVLDVNSYEKALFFAELIRQDLSLWRMHIFIFQDAQNIHYLDASLVSSCEQLKNQLLNIESNIECELELF